MFDTHCHLNFKVFEKNLSDVIERARKNGVDQILIPGTDIVSSERAIEIANQYENIYAAVGIHPHHIMQYQKDSATQFTSPYKNDLKRIEELLSHPKVVAVGEIGLDKHQYQKTKYQNYQINSEFIEDQKELLKIQIQLAIKHDKSLILHNWEAGTELLNLLNKIWDKKLEGRTVFHCCEPDSVETIHELSLLEFAKEHKIYIGVDGDITFNKTKQEFIKQAPLEMLVLETDSPYLLPHLRAFSAVVATKAEQDFGGQAEPLRFPNEPKNLPLIAQFIAKIMNVSINQLIDATTENAKKLFQLDK